MMQSGQARALFWASTVPCKTFNARIAHLTCTTRSALANVENVCPVPLCLCAMEEVFACVADAVWCSVAAVASIKLEGKEPIVLPKSPRTSSMHIAGVQTKSNIVRIVAQNCAYVHFCNICTRRRLRLRSYAWGRICRTCVMS